MVLKQIKKFIGIAALASSIFALSATANSYAADLEIGSEHTINIEYYNNSNSIAELDMETYIFNSAVNQEKASSLVEITEISNIVDTTYNLSNGIDYSTGTRIDIAAGDAVQSDNDDQLRIATTNILDPFESGYYQITLNLGEADAEFYDIINYESNLYFNTDNEYFVQQQRGNFSIQTIANAATPEPEPVVEEVEEVVEIVETVEEKPEPEPEPVVKEAVQEPKLVTTSSGLTRAVSLIALFLAISTGIYYANIYLKPKEEIDY